MGLRACVASWHIGVLHDERADRLSVDQIVVIDESDTLVHAMLFQMRAWTLAMRCSIVVMMLRLHDSDCVDELW